jgi:hypothetical protein
MTTTTPPPATTDAATGRPVPAPARAPTDEQGPSGADVAPGALAEPVDTGLDRLAREIPRLGRLLTSIEELRVQVVDWVPDDAAGRRRRKRAEALLAEAGACAASCRVDDGWAYLNAAHRTALARLDDVSLAVLADRLQVECAAKLTGWRAEAAALSLADADQADRTGLLSRLAAAQQMLDDDSQKTYLRLRLLGRRVAVATALLALAMAALSTLVVVSPGDGGGVLGDQARFAQVVLLGALGAMLSAAISAMDHGSAPRVYELSTPLLATAVARVLTGSAAAVVTVMAAEVELLPVKEEWLPRFAVVSGFSERLVRRVVATLSDAAEHKASAPTKV